jgi:amino acid transporter
MAEPQAEPQLQRTLGSFQIFSASFAFISVAVGVFGTYDEVLKTAGPVGIWLWLLAAGGQVLVALVVAQFASRIALTGSSYQWASRLANPRIGWVFGWLTLWWLVIAWVAVTYALVDEALIPLFGIDGGESTTRLITVALLLVQAVLVIGSTRIVGLLNASAVGVELTIVVILVIALLIAVAVGDSGSVENLTSRGVAANAEDYWGIGGGLMLAMIMGLGTLVGFDSAANLAEEAKNPFRDVPRAIVGSVVAAGVLGMLFLIALTVAIDDITAVSRSESPVAAIMHDQLGPVVEKILLVAISFAFFAAGLVTLATGARLVFAMARDGRFPADRLLRRVNPRTRTPIPATVLVLVAGVVLILGVPGDALIDLITAGTILPLLLYGGTVVLYLAVRGRLEKRENAFSLGRFELPVAITALVWLLFALFVLVTPSTALTPVLIVVGLIALGAVFFAGLLAFNREALDAQPD